MHCNCIVVAWSFVPVTGEIEDMQTTSYYANSEQRGRLIAGLRNLAEFLDQNPQVPAPTRADVMVFPPDSSDAEMFAEIDAIAAQLGVTASDAGSSRGHYSAMRNFGPVEYRAVAIPHSADDESGRGD
jgi:hypothetical protein